MRTLEKVVVDARTTHASEQESQCETQVAIDVLARASSQLALHVPVGATWCTPVDSWNNGEHTPACVGVSATLSRTMANHTSRSFATRARSLCMRRIPRQLPASAFDQHYDGNAAGVANLSGRLLEHLSCVLARSADTASTAYELSVPLLAASVLGPAVHNATPTRATVPVLSERMADALTAEQNAGTTVGSKRCWLVGRLLLAGTAQCHGGRQAQTNTSRRVGLARAARAARWQE